ncbi:MAG: hypothetical protein WAO19_12385 [Candidatus Kryptoniota bacterium]
MNHSTSSVIRLEGGSLCGSSEFILRTHPIDDIFAQARWLVVASLRGNVDHFYGNVVTKRGALSVGSNEDVPT